MFKVKHLLDSKLVLLAIAASVFAVASHENGGAFCAAPQELGPHSHDGPEAVSLSEKAFREFIEKRQEYYVPLFGEDDARVYTKLDREATDNLALITIKSPQNRVVLRGKGIDADRLGGKVTDFAEMLPYFPEITTIYHAEALPGAFWKQAVHLKHLKTITFSHGTITDESLRLLSKHRDLTHLELGRCHISETGFGYLEDLKNLEYISFGGNVTPKAFVTLAKLPKLHSVVLGPFDNNAFARPIDEDTQRAVGTLDGHLKSIGTTEYAYRDVHASFARPFMHMKSLEYLNFDGIAGRLEMSDYEALRDSKSLRYVELGDLPASLSPSQRDTVIHILREINKRGEK